MLHSGDCYETRARAARSQELRGLTRALAGFLFGRAAPRRHERSGAVSNMTPANDGSADYNRAA